ncbi:MAG: sigma-54-dependent Fis family transcriptional regulator [bacterium]|nr:sigma-54-dependent Fis family transcriptional regulator [bacterium]
MGLLNDSDCGRAEALSRVNYCNPFLPERLGYEKVVLGDAFVGEEEAWHKREEEAVRPNLERMTAWAKGIADDVREGLAKGGALADNEVPLYGDVVLYYLYNKYQLDLFEYIEMTASGHGEPSREAEALLARTYDRYQEDMIHYLGVPGSTFSLDEADYFFASFFQLRRAWHHIFDNIIGGSMVSARLRASVWQSIFTCDVHRYRRGLYERMRDITTLITGPSGTGKELVARAVGLSQFIPFDGHRKRFEAHYARCFYPLNLSALSPTLIESELFGHTKGSFTGALNDHEGFFESCPAHGAVFLDELGEMDPAIQVKLLRLLQTRSFRRIGDTEDREFSGKVIAATNRDLTTAMREHRFRADLYYRLCSDVIVTPSLREQLEDSPDQLRNLLMFVARRVAGEDEAGALAEEVQAWISEHLGDDYAWPGNVRELEQCVRNILVRRSYHPAEAPPADALEAILDQVRRGLLTADDLVAQYCTLVYAQTGSYLEASKRLGLDRRTVKARVDTDLLDELRKE